MEDEKVLSELKNYIDPESLILKNNWENVIANTGKDRVAFLPVHPDWNEPRKMWGYYNPLTGLFYPTDALKVLLNAFKDYAISGNKDHKYFIILDEMNLARVEYYMSDLLSLMENMWKKKAKGETAQIHPFLNVCILSDSKDENTQAKKCSKVGDNCKKCPYYPLLKQTLEGWELDKDFKPDGEPIPPRIGYPENLIIIGTVNVDETTFSFSPKVLDRAFVVEFNDVDVDEYCERYNIQNEDFKTFVKGLYDILKPATLHFGYRVIHEMWVYLGKSGEGSEIPDESLDFLLKSKVLPKIHGTEEQVGDVLVKLFEFCKKEEPDNSDQFKTNPDKQKWWEVEIQDNSDFKYPDSAKKIQDMCKRMKAVGYASFF